MKKFEINGTIKEFQSFNDLVRNTSRTERNNLFGQSLVYEENCKLEGIAKKVADLLEETESHLKHLKEVQSLIQADLKEAERKEELMKEISALSYEKLKELTELVS